MILKRGSKGDDVKKLQKALGITADGDFGPKTEEAVKKFQKEHNLVVDGIVGDKTWGALFPTTSTNQSNDTSLKITKGYINTHITRSPNRPIKYIAIHYTAGSTSKPGTAMSTRNVFLKRSASADFVVDDETIVQINPDLKNYYCWSVGDAKNKYSSGGQLKNIATNKNTISIEMCSSLASGYGASHANHAGWYITDKVLNNTIKLVRYLMKTYNIPKSNVVRHYDITGKLCPGVEGWNNESLYTNAGKSTGKKNNSSEWEKFKTKI